MKVDEEVIRKLKVLIAVLKDLIPKRKFITDLPSELFSENPTLIKFLSYFWHNFASRFKQLSDVMLELQYVMDSPSNKATFILRTMVEATVEIPLEELVLKLEDIIESL